jgi:uncharacterized protein (TIGR03000 family)
MRQRRVGAAVLLGAAALLLVPAAASAQVSINIGRYGGGYYGAMPGFYYGSMPGYYTYGYSPYSYSTYGYSPYSTYGGWSYPSYTWGNYYTYPNYATNSYYSSAPPATSYYGPGYSYGTPPAAETRDNALLNVRLPDANAELWVEGKLTQQRGTNREFSSPPLTPGKNYTYEVRARWTENGKQVERTRTVPVRANATATVDFTAPANNSRVDEIDKGRPETLPNTKPPDKNRSDKQ